MFNGTLKYPVVNKAYLQERLHPLHQLAIHICLTGAFARQVRSGHPKGFPSPSSWREYPIIGTPFSLAHPRAENNMRNAPLIEDGPGRTFQSLVFLLQVARGWLATVKRSSVHRRQRRSRPRVVARKIYLNRLQRGDILDSLSVVIGILVVQFPEAKQGLC